MEFRDYFIAGSFLIALISPFVSLGNVRFGRRVKELELKAVVLSRAVEVGAKLRRIERLFRDARNPGFTGDGDAESAEAIHGLVLESLASLERSFARMRNMPRHHSLALYDQFLHDFQALEIRVGDLLEMAPKELETLKGRCPVVDEPTQLVPPEAGGLKIGSRKA